VVELLNPRGAEAEIVPVALAQAILAEAQGLTSPQGCARLDDLAGQLHDVRPEDLDGDAARIAFWTNLYNAMLLHRLCLKPVRGSVLMQLRLFGGVGYEVGGRPYTLNLIEHGLLRGNRRAPLHLRRPLRASDPRLAGAPARPDFRIHFALNCGARSCPPVRQYDPGELDAQLETATRAYLEAETTVDAAGCRVQLPGLMRLYRRDFGGADNQLDFAARYVPNVESAIQACGERIGIDHSRFDWSAVPER
jgi:Protein of unknown function, DUF547